MPSTSDGLPPELFPKTVKMSDGREIVVANEICACSHFRTQHIDFVVTAATTAAMGHGSCMACNCTKFTWKSMVIVGSTEAARMLASIVPDTPIDRESVEELEQRINKLIAERDRYHDLLKVNERYGDEEMRKRMQVTEEKKALEEHVKMLDERLKEFTERYKRVDVKGRRSILLPDE